MGVKYIVLLALTLGCTTCSYNKVDKPLISIEVKNFIKYKNDKIGIENYMISPIDSNIIWIFNTNGDSYELSLVDSTWNSLKSKFGKYSWGLKKNNVAIDSIDKELLWICNFHRGLISYNTINKTYLEFNTIRSISSICFLPNDIFVGTFSGLYKINRKLKTATKSKNIAETNVYDIKKINNDILLINEKYEFDLKSDSIIKTREPDANKYFNRKIRDIEITYSNNNELSIGKTNFNYPSYLLNNIIIEDKTIWIPSPSLKDGLIKYDLISNSFNTIKIGYDFSNYKLINDFDNIWFYNQYAILCFNKNNHSVKPYPIDFVINNLSLDQKYLYLNTWHSFEIYEKKYLIDNSKDIVTIITEEEGFKKLIDSLEIYNNSDYKKGFNSYKILSSRYNASSNKWILEQLDNIKESISWLLPYEFDKLKLFENYVIDSIDDDYFIAEFYLKAIMRANHCGKLKESLHYDSILTISYPNFRDINLKKEMAEVESGFKNYKIILSTKEPEDENLWKLGMFFYELFFKIGPITEASTYEMSYPFTYFDSLVEKYPNSKYADDAEFLMLKHIEGGSHEGGDNSYNLDAIEAYKALLRKYPHSEFKPEIYHKISDLYSNCESTDEDRPGYYKLALDYIDKILNEFPNYSQTNEINNMKKELEQSLSDVLWKFIIQSDKVTYDLNEPIIITFSLKNIDSKPKPIELSEDRDIPNFYIDIIKHWVNNNIDSYEMIYIENNTKEYNKKTKDSIINIDMIYSESWNIKLTARNNKWDPPGRFNLNKEGRYKIQAYCSMSGGEEILLSNEIWINIKNRE